MSTTDDGVFTTISRLEQEERQLHNDPTRTDEGQARLDKIKVELDQCWDLLRQRRALREFGEDPDRAKVRSPQIVEGYEQ